MEAPPDTRGEGARCTFPRGKNAEGETRRGIFPHWKNRFGAMDRCVFRKRPVRRKIALIPALPENLSARLQFAIMANRDFNGIFISRNIIRSRVSRTLFGDKYLLFTDVRYE